MWAQIIVSLVGVWLMAAPAVLGYEHSRAADIDRILGPVVATFGIIACWPVLRECRWFNLLWAAALIAAPLLLGYNTPALLNSVLCGIGVGALTPVRGRVRQPFGGGWRSLWASHPHTVDPSAPDLPR